MIYFTFSGLNKLRFKKAISGYFHKLLPRELVKEDESCVCGEFNITLPIKVSRFAHCSVTFRDKQQKECCNEIKHEDKLPFSTPSQPCLLNKHCRLDSLALQSLHPESPIDPPQTFSTGCWEKKTSRERWRKRGRAEEEGKKSQRDRLNIWLC